MEIVQLLKWLFIVKLESKCQKSRKHGENSICPISLSESAIEVSAKQLDEGWGEAH